MTNQQEGEKCICNMENSMIKRAIEEGWAKTYGCPIHDPHFTSLDEALTPKSRKDSVTKSMYQRVHYWLNKNYGIADKCENKDCSKKSKSYGWALIHGETYDFNRDNFRKLCRSCHSSYDLTEDGKQRIAKANTGRKCPPKLIERNRSTKGKIKYPSLWKKVYAYKDGKLCHVFNSITEASEKLKIVHSNVSMGASTGKFKVRGYQLSFIPK